MVYPGEAIARCELTDGRLRLRPFVEADAPAFFEAVQESRGELARWFSWAHPAYDRQESTLWVATRPAAWDAGHDYAFAIEDGAGALLGACGLNQRNLVHHFANLWYWVRTSQAGRGIIPDASRLVAAFGFDVLRLHRIEIVIDVNNRPSQRVAEKVGAVREGMLRHRLDLLGRPCHALMYSLLPLDLKGRRPAP